jgi:hypothetical protein
LLALCLGGAFLSDIGLDFCIWNFFTDMTFDSEKDLRPAIAVGAAGVWEYRGLFINMAPR